MKRKRTLKKTSRQKKRGPEETEISEEGKGGSNTADAETGCSGDDQIEAGNHHLYDFFVGAKTV